MDVTIGFETVRLFSDLTELLDTDARVSYNELEARNFKKAVRLQAMDYGAQICSVLADVDNIRLLKNPGQVIDLFLNGEFAIKVDDAHEWFDSLRNEIAAKIIEEGYDCTSYEPAKQRYRVTFFDDESKEPLSEELGHTY